MDSEVDGSPLVRARGGAGRAQAARIGAGGEDKKNERGETRDEKKMMGLKTDESSVDGKQKHARACGIDLTRTRTSTSSHTSTLSLSLSHQLFWFHLCPHDRHS